MLAILEFFSRRTSSLLKLSLVIHKQETEKLTWRWPQPWDTGYYQGGKVSSEDGKRGLFGFSSRWVHPLPNSHHILYIPLLAQGVVIKYVLPSLANELLHCREGMPDSEQVFRICCDDRWMDK